MNYQKLETEKYYVEALQKKLDAIQNRKATQSFQTFLFAVLAIGVGVYLTQQYPNWIPELVNTIEAQALKWV